MRVEQAWEIVPFLVGKEPFGLAELTPRQRAGGFSALGIQYPKALPERTGLGHSI